MSLMILIADSKWPFYATVRKKIATGTTMAMNLKIHQTSLTLFDAIGLFLLMGYSGFNIKYAQSIVFVA